jgi:hypothetical protein
VIACPQYASSALLRRKLSSTFARIASKGMTASRGGLGFGFSTGQMRCFQYTSSIARREAKRVSKLIVDSPLSTASRVGAPGAAVAESSSASVATQFNNDKSSFFTVNLGLLVINLAGATGASSRERFGSCNL